MCIVVGQFSGHGISPLRMGPILYEYINNCTRIAPICVRLDVRLQIVLALAFPIFIGD
jgi:hypothetical protein